MQNQIYDESAMIGALGKCPNGNYIGGAIRNGVTKEELRAIIHVIGIYCGVPQAVECMRVARKVLDNKYKPPLSRQRPTMAAALRPVWRSDQNCTTKRKKRTKLMI